MQAAILYTVAAASKSAAVKTNLLKLAASKYAGSVFIDKIQAALGAGAPAVATAPATALQAAPAASSAHVPVQLNKDAQGPDAVKTFYAVLELTRARKPDEDQERDSHQLSDREDDDPLPEATSPTETSIPHGWKGRRATGSGRR